MTANTDWFHAAKWGVFCHYLADDALTAQQWNEQVDAFDVQGLAQQLDKVKAPYFFITLGQNSGHFCSPNQTYDNYVGITPSKCSRRDLVADLYEAMNPLGIKLMTYLPAGAPDRDPVAMEKLEWHNGKFVDYRYPDGPPAGEKPDDRLVNFQLKWEAVIKEWSTRWGENVHGWWFDGCYFANAMYRHDDAPNFHSFAAAAKAGNPNSIVAFNPGVLTPVICYTDAEDYTAGEISNNLPVSDCYQEKKTSRFIDGAQYHILSFLGNGWGAAPPRFSDELAISYTKHIVKQDGVVTWDVPIQKNGLIHPDFIPQLQALGNALA